MENFSDVEAFDPRVNVSFSNLNPVTTVVDIAKGTAEVVNELNPIPLIYKTTESAYDWITEISPMDFSKEDLYASDKRSQYLRSAMGSPVFLKQFELVGEHQNEFYDEHNKAVDELTGEQRRDIGTFQFNKIDYASILLIVFLAAILIGMKYYSRK